MNCLELWFEGYGQKKFRGVSGICRDLLVKETESGGAPVQKWKVQGPGHETLDPDLDLGQVSPGAWLAREADARARATRAPARRG